MTTNRLAKSSEPAFDRSNWTLQQHCEHANAQLILNDVNIGRRAKGLPAVRWVIEGKRVVMAFA